MEACGLIVEYNPFHNGHQYHVEKAREQSKADCLIAVMSGTFLQRGEPAIIDKFHRAKAALASGVDIVIELPYAYAVQSSRYFAKGAVLSLHALGASSICFGSESGEIAPFYDGVRRLNEKRQTYDELVKRYLKQGLSYPEASSKAYQDIGIEGLDLFQPNNILGFSYVRTIVEHQLPIRALTIKRKSSHYHDEEIKGKIASATSIRKALKKHALTDELVQAIPEATKEQLLNYKEKAGIWHDWDRYFPLLHYRVMTMTKEQLNEIHGVDEGIEGRIIEAMKRAENFNDLLKLVKTKRYTQVRLQRMFVHILTNTTKKQMEPFLKKNEAPYIRLLGMTENGRAYLNRVKKALDMPLIVNLNKMSDELYLDERALRAYYSILPDEKRLELFQQEFQLPIIYP